MVSIPLFSTENVVHIHFLLCIPVQSMLSNYDFSQLHVKHFKSIILFTPHKNLLKRLFFYHFHFSKEKLEVEGRPKACQWRTRFGCRIGWLQGSTHHSSEWLLITWPETFNKESCHIASCLFVHNLKSNFKEMDLFVPIISNFFPKFLENS